MDQDGRGPRAAAPGETARRGWPARAPGLLTFLSALYAAAVVGACLALYLASDRWWVATLLLYGPRWPLAVPLGVLLPAAAVFRRRLLGLLGPVLLVAVFFLMGLCLPWASLGGAGPRGQAVRVLTCNVHRSELDPVALGALVVETGPDVVALQGWSSGYEPVVFADGEWYVRRDDQLCLASRFPILGGELLDDPAFTAGDYAIARYRLDAPGGALDFVSLHLASPRDGLDEVLESHGARVGRLEANSALRRRQSERAARWLDACPGPLLIAGDFNTPPESRTYRECWSRYTNAFSAAGFGFGPTFFTRRTAVRIDHILAGPGWHCRRCWIGPPVGSPHRPVLADLVRTPPPD
jgi:endonuclease/exonuclease/phosphatase (EEP) superfamily protein YafD